ERLLADRVAQRGQLELTLAPSRLALEVGDAIAVAGEGEGPFEITEIRDGAARRITARAIPPLFEAVIVSGRPAAVPTAAVPRAIPVVVAAHLPPDPANPGQSRLLLAACASPWPGEVTFHDEVTGTQIARLTRSCALGELDAALAPGQALTWDETASLTVRLYAGHLASADDALVLAGGNRLVIETDSGAWEVVAFAEALLLSPGLYRLTRLLRGQMGTGHAIGPAAAGRRVVVLDDRPLLLAAPGQWLGETRPLRAYAGRADPAGTSVALALDSGPVLPLPPVHLRAERAPGSDDVALSWVRRSRADTDSWGVTDAPLEHAPEAYAVTILDGTVPVRTLAAAAPTLTYTAAAQVEDFGAPPPRFGFRVAQMSPVFGAGHATEGTFDA
ncbi:phage tail baseplate protein, partial [Devosia sp.]|uniref:GTA baseplate fiber-binding domain-containing protein n=1 Tax=Devosia sp. TaxID=1871048 RepID=UPI002F09D19E